MARNQFGAGLVSGLGEVLVRFRSAFHGAGLHSARTMADGVGGQVGQFGLDESGGNSRVSQDDDQPTRGDRLQGGGEAQWTRRTAGRVGRSAPHKQTVSVRDLRRSAVTNWSKVADIQTVMKTAGQRNIQTTQRYDAAGTEDQVNRIREAARVAVKDLFAKQSRPRLTLSEPRRKKKASTHFAKALSENDLSD